MTDDADDRRFRVNGPTVVGEVVDGEAIVIHLVSGNYYSLSGAGGVVWGLLEQVTTEHAVIEHLRARYEGDPQEITDAVHSLFGQLTEEGLVAVTNDPVTEAPVPTAPQEEFVAPHLERYIDMQNLIQLDPILEVDEHGWPLTKEA